MPAVHDDWGGERVIVTGACGFVGVNLVRSLVDRGAHVVALDLPSSDWSRLPSSVDRVPVDLLDEDALTEALSGPAGEAGVVVHLAARTDIDGKTLADYAVNTVGTANLLSALGRSTTMTRFVHYSTQLVCGLFDEKRLIDESEPFRTNTVYGASKIESEEIVRDRCGESGTPFTIIRPTSVYGPWGKAPYRDFFRTIRSGRYVHAGRADNEVSLVHVQNLVDLTLLLARHPEAAGEVYFGSDRRPYTMRAIVDEVATHYGVRVRTVPVWLLTVVAYGLGLFKLVGVPVPLYPFRLRNLLMTYRYDMGKSLALGYDPRFGLEDGIADTLAWYDEHPEF